MDDGFDLSLPVFAGKIAGRFTIDCSATDDGQRTGEGDPDATEKDSPSTKELFIAALVRGDEACHLRPGVAFARPQAFGAIEKFRDRWNNAIERGESLLDEFTLSEAIEIELALAAATAGDSSAFHGTTTASTIARANPDVRLTIVQVPLSSQATAMTSVQCPTQADVDATAALLCDDDVRRAYVERPRASIDRELDELLTVNHIGVWNRSFGKPSRAATEAALLEAGCGKIDLGEYLATKGELDATYDACHPAQGYLEVLAAGNDGSRLDGPEDQEGCRDRRPTSIVVGSYGRSLKRSAFTNYGRCVDVFAPGEDIVATLPDGWLMPMSGTSYSAPLMARWVSLRNDDTFSPTEARNAVLALADRRRRIPEDQFPSELVYSGDPEAVGDEATTGPNEQTQAAGSETRVVNSLEWRRALWPVVAARK